MDWLGIGVLIIGIALLILVFLLIKPLIKLATVLESLLETTDRLPTMLEETSKQTMEIFQKGNEALANANDQIAGITPLFHIVRDAGEASRQLSSLALEKTMTLKKNTSEAKEFAQRKRLQGFYGVLSLLFYLLQKRKNIKQALPHSK